MPRPIASSGRPHASSTPPPPPTKPFPRSPGPPPRQPIGSAAHLRGRRGDRVALGPGFDARADDEYAQGVQAVGRAEDGAVDAYASAADLAWPGRGPRQGSGGHIDDLFHVLGAPIEQTSHLQFGRLEHAGRRPGRGAGGEERGPPDARSRSGLPGCSQADPESQQLCPARLDPSSNPPSACSREPHRTGGNALIGHLPPPDRRRRGVGPHHAPVRPPMPCAPYRTRPYASARRADGNGRVHRDEHHRHPDGKRIEQIPRTMPRPGQLAALVFVSALILFALLLEIV